MAEIRNSFVLILDDDVIAFVNERAEGDVNGYLNGLLMQERSRQARSSLPEGYAGSSKNLQNLLDNTPDASV
jgi:hypothetical protein